MGWFDKLRKKGDVIDYTDYQHRIPQKKSSNQTISTSSAISQTPSSSANSSSSESAFSFLSNFAEAANAETNLIGTNSAISDNKNPIIDKKMLSLTQRYEELSNQIYRMQQRIELLEQKLRAKGSY